MMMRVVAIVMGVLLWTSSAHAATGVRVDMPLRGKAMALTVYRPATTARGTIVMGSGDVGWVGLAVSRAQELSTDGYVVVGVNMREYLSAFTVGTSHLSAEDIQRDFGELSRFLRARGLLTAPVILSGVSEGAGIAVVAAASPENHAWVNGVITMGLPELSEIAWRWSDFTSWITKKDAAEPSVRATEFVGRIAPVPLAMIQSMKDEYVPEGDYRAIERAARDPKTLTLIAASNHRFTDRIPELRRAYSEALAWVVDHNQSRVN
ncbi:MAG: AcvB/VirJ family lysyl-phosphatidylglycerol hydrolase [Vicinamibacterales bacterium]